MPPLILKPLLAWRPSRRPAILDGGDVINSHFVDLNTVSICSWSWNCLLPVNLLWFLHIQGSSLEIPFLAFSADGHHLAVVGAWPWQLSSIMTNILMWHVDLIIFFATFTEGVEMGFHCVAGLAMIKFTYQLVVSWRWRTYSMVKMTFSTYLISQRQAS